MTNYYQRLKIEDWKSSPNLQSLIFNLLFLIIPVLYVSTLAQSLVLGDPTEYTFVANILGIAHPPGYAFITLLGKLFQTLIPFGEIPWRMHLLSAASATLAALFVYGTVKTVISNQLSVVSLQSPISNLQSPIFNLQSSIIALFTALTVATAVNFWQHALHANPHIITATFLAANLFFLTRWAYGDKVTSGQGDKVKERVTAPPRHRVTVSPKWLYAFSLSAGLGVTHHPLTVFGFPAYALFILTVWWHRERLENGGWRLETGDWRDSLQSLISRLFRVTQRNWRTLLKMIAFALLGLSVWLYFPIRSPMGLDFGPSTMNTLNGFLDHVLARNLTVNLFHFGLADQIDRALVFWTLLRLQYALPVILLAVAGLLWLARAFAPLLMLYGVTFLGTYLFVMNTVQDVMAYLLGPFLLIGLLAGIGLNGLLAALFHRIGADNTSLPSMRLRGAIWLIFFLFGPVWQIAGNMPRVSLRDYDEGQAYVTAVFDQFAGTGEGAVLLNDWEHMTPLWYTQFVEKRWPNPTDVRLEFVSSAKPWIEFVFDCLPGGPVYLSNYRREIVDGGFRLRPSGPFYQVVEPGEMTVPPELTLVDVVGSEIEVVGYALPQTAVSAGDYVPLTLAMRTMGTADFYVPVLRVGQMRFPFTTDSHLTTPNWQPGEVIIERFDFALPHDLSAGEYPVSLDLKNLSADEFIPLDLNLGQLTVTARRRPARTDHLLANFRQRVGLAGAVASRDGRYHAPWSEPITARPGDVIHLTLKWEALDYAEESYTIFVHLIDPANRPIVTLDYTPLGGATPTHLWFPKWLPGQQMHDPYRLQIPPDLPPGTYLIEVGLYEMVSNRRLHISDVDGNLVGDRYILGPVVVGGGS